MFRSCHSIIRARPNKSRDEYNIQLIWIPQTCVCSFIQIFPVPNRITQNGCDSSHQIWFSFSARVDEVRYFDYKQITINSSTWPARALNGVFVSTREQEIPMAVFVIWSNILTPGHHLCFTLVPSELFEIDYCLNTVLV